MRVSRLLLCSAVSAVAVLLVTTASPAADQISVQGVRVPSVSVPRVPTPGTPGSKIDPVAGPRASVQGGPRRLTAARAEAFAEAARRGLNYLPGEVVVKFRSGMGAASMQRALDAVSSRPNADGLEWHGDVALLRDASQPDAHQLAAQLSAQPEVEYAEPNYIARISPLEKEFAPGGAPATLHRTRRPGSGVPPHSGRRARRATRTSARTSGISTCISMPAAWDVVARRQQPISSSPWSIRASPLAAQTMTFPLWTGSAIQNVQMPFAREPGSAGKPPGVAEGFRLPGSAGARRRHGRPRHACQRHDRTGDEQLRSSWRAWPTT